MFRKLLTLDAITLSAHLTAILMDNDKYKELVGQRGEAAQSLLDLLQAVCPHANYTYFPL